MANTQNANTLIIDAIKVIAQEKKIAEQAVVDSAKIAIKTTYEKEYEPEHVDVEIDMNVGTIKVFKLLTVLKDEDVPEELVDQESGIKEKIYDDYTEILLSDAKKLDPNAIPGDVVRQPVDFIGEISDETNKRGRFLMNKIASLLKQNITQEANKTIYNEWQDKKNQIIFAEVDKYDSRRHEATIDLGNGLFGIVPRKEQIPGEDLIPGQRYKFAIKDVLQQSKGWPIILSRASGELVRDALFQTIPEIQNGIIQIMKVGRAVGFKTKVAVKSNQPGIEPIGACIGSGGIRKQSLLQEIGALGEELEFIEWDDDYGKFIVKACAQATIKGYKVVEPVYAMAEDGTLTDKEISRKKVYIIIDDNKLALIIGRRGQNVKVLSDLLDADVTAVTTSEAPQMEEVKGWTKAEPYVPSYVAKKAVEQSSSSKFDVMTNFDFMDTDTTVEPEEQVEETKEEVVEQPSTPVVEVNSDDYADELAQLDEITK